MTFSLVMLVTLALLVVALAALGAFAAYRSSRSSAATIEAAFVQQQESLLKEIETLREELQTMAAAGRAAPAPAAEPKISEDHLMIMGAVLACHFGKRVKIRRARILSVGSGSNVWSQQGRAAVQASHSNRF